MILNLYVIKKNCNLFHTKLVHVSMILILYKIKLVNFYKFTFRWSTIMKLVRKILWVIVTHTWPNFFLKESHLIKNFLFPKSVEGAGESLQRLVLAAPSRRATLGPAATDLREPIRDQISEVKYLFIYPHLLL